MKALEVQVLADKLQQHVPKGSEEPDGAFGGLEVSGSPLKALIQSRESVKPQAHYFAGIIAKQCIRIEFAPIRQISTQIRFGSSQHVRII